MNLIFNRNQEHDVIASVPVVRYSLTAYSNLGYVSTSDLTVDSPSIYSIEQGLQSENSSDVKKIFLFSSNNLLTSFFFSSLVEIFGSNNKCIASTSHTYEI